jgi:lipid-binding SYLF domain-containing protein
MMSSCARDLHVKIEKSFANARRPGRRMALRAAAAAVIGVLTGTGHAAPSVQEQRDDIRATARDTLERLYRAQPSARQAIARAAGYGAFSNFGMKILLAGGGSGKGLVVNNRTKQETFMKMVEVQAGLGIGVDKYRLVWVFERASDLDQFVNSGWELGAQATVTAQADGKGDQVFAGAMSVTPGVWLYQLSDEGLALDITAKGTKYFKDDELN